MGSKNSIPSNNKMQHMQSFPMALDLAAIMTIEEIILFSYLMDVEYRIFTNKKLDSKTIKMKNKGWFKCSFHKIQKAIHYTDTQLTRSISRLIQKMFMSTMIEDKDPKMIRWIKIHVDSIIESYDTANSFKDNG